MGAIMYFSVPSSGSDAVGKKNSSPMKAAALGWFQARHRTRALTSLVPNVPPELPGSA